jgi:hypothetical protein
MKFGWDWDFELKKSFECYRQISLKDLMKIALNFVHFASTKVNEIKARVNLCSKSPFYYQGSKFNEYLINFLISLAEFSKIVWWFLEFDKIWQYWMKVNKS